VTGVETVPTERTGKLIEFVDNDTTGLPPIPVAPMVPVLPLVWSVTVNVSEIFPFTFGRKATLNVQRVVLATQVDPSGRVKLLDGGSVTLMGWPRGRPFRSLTLKVCAALVVLIA
jgi:hypothetical protein